jgi:hypothetical protein
MLYEEVSPIKTRALIIIITLSLMVSVLGFFFSVYLMIFSYLAGFIALVTWSVYRYAQVSLDRTTLRVGKDVIPLNMLDKTFGVKLGEDGLSHKEIGSLELGIRPYRKKYNIQILGKAYGRQKVEGRRWLVIKMQSDDRRYVLQPKDRDKVKEIIDEILGLQSKQI